VLRSAILLRNSLIAASLILLVATLLISFFTARSISLPIGKLTGAVKGITTENLDIEIDPGVERSNDEIGQLARAFKKMASSLNLALDKIKKNAEELRESYGIINRSPAVVFLWRNLEGWPVEIVSDSVIKLFGYSKEEFTSGEVSYDKVVHEDDVDRVAQ